MIRFLRREMEQLVAAGATGLLIGCVLGLGPGEGSGHIVELAVQVAGASCGLLYLLRFMLLVVSLDSDKPRAWRCQNGSASDS